MNFLDAVQALKDGKCKSIERDGVMPLNLSVSGYIMNCIGLFVLNTEHILADDWQLVNPVIKYEEVEVVKYMVKGEMGDFFYDCKPEYPCIKLTGTIKKEIKQKVKHRKEIVVIPVNQDIPLSARFYAEWEE